MKLILSFAIFTLIGISAVFAQVNKPAMVGLVVPSAFEDYTKYYEQRNGVPYKDQLIGYKADISVAQLVTEVNITFFSSNTRDQVIKEYYWCEVNNEKLSYICVYQKKIDKTQVKLVDRKLSYADMQVAASEAFKLFAKKTASVDLIDSFKIWHAGSHIEVRIDYSAKGAFFSCHYHGKEIDCHRRQSAGPGEPL